MKYFMCVFVLTFAIFSAPLRAEVPAKAADPTATQGKLDKILAAQQQILLQLEEIKKELQIVKARATR
jgi:hypothetical protein